MTQPLVLASGSEIRATLLRNAGVPFEVVTTRVDEVAVRNALEGQDEREHRGRGKRTSTAPSASRTARC